MSTQRPAATTARRLLSSRDICAMLGINRVTLYRMERAGRFPASIEISTNRVGWLVEDVERWLASRPRRTRTAEAAATVENRA
jgi:predicted DNA-binding transcriptional regulator AlpA